MPKLPSRPRLGAIALLVSALVALGAAGAARPVSSPAIDAALDVAFVSQGGHSYFLAGLEVPSSALGVGDNSLPWLPASLTVTSPPGFSVATTALAPGTTVGQVTGVLMAGSGDLSGSTFGGTTLTVVDPAAFAADPAAQACAPGPHALALSASFSVLGQTVSLPAALDSDPAGNRFTLRICTAVAASPQFPKGLVLWYPSVYVADLVSGPTGTGEYLWNGRVMPTTVGAVQADPARAFDVRARVVVPYVLTASARYDAKRKAGIVTGKLMLQGKPQPETEIEISAYAGDDDLAEVSAVTDSSGAFSARIAVKGRTDIELEVPTDPRPCAGASDAPAGCVSETLMSPNYIQTTVRAPRPSDAQRRPIARDNAVARRGTVKVADVPKGWNELAQEVEECDAFTPDLRRLTVTGEARSHWFLSGKRDVTVGSITTVYRTRADAKTALERTALLANARCQAELGVDDDYSIETVAKAGFPPVGDAARAFHIAWSAANGPDENGELVFVQVGRAVIQFQSYSYNGPRPTMLRQVVRQVTARARQ